LKPKVFRASGASATVIDMNGTRKNAKDNWGGYIGLSGLAVWGIILRKMTK